MATLASCPWRVLLISCEKYEEKPLYQCHEAARLVEQEIQRCMPLQEPIHFLMDLNPQELSYACDEFVRRPTVNQRLFLYFAGHGFEQEGRNFLVPVSRGPSVCIQDLRLKLEKGCLLMVAWDACRVHKPFYDEPSAFETERLPHWKTLKTDYMYLFSCLSGEERFDDLEFASALVQCFSMQEVKLPDVAQIVKTGMCKHRSDSTLSLALDPHVPPTLVGVSSESIAVQLYQSDVQLYWLYWTPCLYVVATLLDLTVRCGATAGFTRIEYSTRVTFLLSTSSFFWAAFSHCDLQTASCSFPLVNALREKWKAVEATVFRLRAPFTTLCQVFTELYHNKDVYGAITTSLLGAVWLIFSSHFLSVVRTWRDEASPLAQARAARLWMWVFFYAVVVSVSNFRMLWDGLDQSLGWVEVYWQSYLLLLALSLPFTLVCRCDPVCSRRARYVAVYSSVPVASVMAVILFVLTQGLALHMFWLAGILIEYLALFGLGLAVYIWQSSRF